MDKQKPALVIMAAGMGSRFGGLKQIEPVDPEGHIIIDFSLFDSWRAGFRDVVFIIKREMEAEFRACIGDRMERYFHVSLTVCRRALKFRKDGRSRGGPVTRWPAAGAR